MHRTNLAAALVAAAALTACGRAATIESLRLPEGGVPGERADPALAVDPASGDLLISWTAGDSSGHAIQFARSTDGGSTWSAPVTVAGPAADIHPHGESAQRLVASPGALAIVWSNNVMVPGRRWPASNIRVARSSDGGRSWSTALTVNDDSAGAPAGHLFHGVALEGDSSLVVAWLDERAGPDPMAGHQHAAATPVVGHEHSGEDAEPDAHIWVARSNDLGVTWSRTNQPLWGAACPCCRVTMARGPDGHVTLAWRKHYAGNVRDIVLAPLVGSSAVGAPPEPTRVHADEWVYPGCPHTGPGLGLDSAGVAHVAWFTGKQGSAGVYYARQTAAGATTFTTPVPLVTGRTLPASHAGVAPRSNGGAFVGLDIAPDGRRLASFAIIDGAGQVLSRTTLDTLEGADHPQVVSLRGGGAVMAWTLTGARSAVRLARVKESS